MNNTSKNLLILIVVLIIAVGGYLVFAEDGSFSSFFQSSFSPKGQQLPTKEIELSERAQTFSVSGGQAGLFREITLSPFYLQPGETQHLVLKLSEPSKAKEVTAEVKDDANSKQLQLKRVNSPKQGEVFYSEWQPEQITPGESYSIKFSYTTSEEQNDTTLSWQAKSPTGFLDQFLFLASVPQARAAKACDALKDNADAKGDIVWITQDCEIGADSPTRDIGWGVNNGNLRIMSNNRLTIRKGTTLDVNGTLYIEKGAEIQMDPNTKIRFDDAVKPRSRILKANENTVITKPANPVVVRECTPGATTTKSDTCSYACCNEEDECVAGGCSNSTSIILVCQENGTWPDKEVSASCPEGCTVYDSQACYNNDVYWYNSCGGRESRADNCGSDSATDNYRCYNSNTAVEREYIERGCEEQPEVGCYEESDWRHHESCETNEICENGDCVSDNDPPVARFDYSPSNPDTDTTISFDASDSYDPDGDPLNFTWYFGDGNTDSGEFTSHGYSSADSYTVTLQVKDGNGGSDTERKTISVEEAQELIADFIYNPDSPETEEVITFDGSPSQAPDGTIDSYEWDFGDGSSGSTEGDKTINYGGSGNKIAAGDIDGDGEAEIATFSGGTWYVDSNNNYTWDGEPSDTKFNYGNSGNEVGIGQFDGDGEAEITTFSSGCWWVDMNNDYSFDSSVDKKFCGYGGDGDSVAVTGAGQIATYVGWRESWWIDDNDNYDWEGDPPDKKIVGYGPGDQGAIADLDNDWEDELITFSGGTWYVDSNNNHTWDDPSGSSGSFTGKIVEHTYDSAGQYNVTLTVTSGGESDSETKTVSVGTANEPPTADFNYSPSSPDTSDTISFTNQSSDSDGWISSYSWSFGDGSSSNQENPSHSYSSSGNYTVTLTVTDNNGATDSVSKTISVGSVNQPPEASFTIDPGTTLEPNQDFSVTSTSEDPDGEIAECYWDWGNGYDDYGCSEGGYYPDTGSYTITLTVTDDDGATDKATKEVTVEEDEPADSEPKVGIDTDQGTNVTVTKGETVTPSVKAIDDDGVSHVNYRNVTTGEWGKGELGNCSGASCEKNWTIDTSNLSAGESYTYIGAAKVTDGSTGNTETVLSDNISSPDYYHSSVTIRVESGNSAPVAELDAPSSVTAGTKVTFDASGSYDSDGSIEDYDWDYHNDGSYNAYTSDPTLDLTLDNTGTFEMKVKVTDNDGASDTAVTSVTVEEELSGDIKCTDTTDSSATLEFSYSKELSDGEITRDGSQVWDLWGDNPGSTITRIDDGLSSDTNYTYRLKEGGTVLDSTSCTTEEEAIELPSCSFSDSTGIWASNNNLSGWDTRCKVGTDCAKKKGIDVVNVSRIETNGNYVDAHGTFSGTPQNHREKYCKIGNTTSLDSCPSSVNGDPLTIWVKDQESSWSEVYDAGCKLGGSCHFQGGALEVNKGVDVSGNTSNCFDIGGTIENCELCIVR